MEKLLTTFSLSDIILFIVLFAATIKGVVSWIEWAKDKIRNKVQKENIYDEFRKEIAKVHKSQEEIKSELDILNNKVNILSESDKDDIKAWITERHHYFCYTLGYIDDYNLDCIERRFKHYKDEGGNSFIEDFMKEIRALPKKTNTDCSTIFK